MTNNDLAQIDALIRKNLKGVATKKDLKDFATKKDLLALEKRIRIEMATKKDLASLESRLRKDIKNDIDDAVAQITSVIIPLEERVDATEGHLGIVNP